MSEEPCEAIRRCVEAGLMKKYKFFDDQGREIEVYGPTNRGQPFFGPFWHDARLPEKADS